MDVEDLRLFLLSCKTKYLNGPSVFHHRQTSLVPFYSYELVQAKSKGVNEHGEHRVVCATKKVPENKLNAAAV